MGRWRAARDRHELEDTAMTEVRRLAYDDVTVFGEQLSLLDDEVSDRELDRATLIDYQQALHAFEVAGQEVPRLSTPGELSTVTDTLASGRYALACVRARAAGDTPPERRVPCFFEPQHGPSARDVVWTMPRRGTQKFPACAACASLVESGEDPPLRMVTMDGRRVPYWEAGATQRPYSRGYFSSAVLEPVVRLTKDQPKEP